MSSTTTVDRYTEATSARSAKSANKSGLYNLNLAQPKSAEEIANILIDKKRYPSPVRPVGSDSSVSRCTQTADGTRVDLSLLNRVLALDKHTVTVQAGIRLRELAEHLAADNMELACGCVNPDRTIGGAISSPTLGGNMPGDACQLASAVTHITLINGLGRKVEVTEKLPDLLTMVRMSYGLLGIVYSVTLRIRPIQSYMIRSSKQSYADFIGLIPFLTRIQGAVHVSLLPFRDRAFVEVRHPDDADRSSPLLKWKLRDWAANTVLPNVVRSVSKVVPVKNIRDPLIDGFTEATHTLFSSRMTSTGSNSTEQTGRFKALDLNPTSVSCTWFFPADKFQKVLTDYKTFCVGHYRNMKYRCDLPAEVWRIDKDQYSLLSPSFDGPVYALKLCSVSDDGWDDYLLEFSEFAAHFKGIPAFNLTKGYNPGYPARIYGDRLRRFRDIRDQLDPYGRLLNQFFEEFMN
jgi:hypothetical protein